MRQRGQAWVPPRVLLVDGVYMLRAVVQLLAASDMQVIVVTDDDKGATRPVRCWVNHRDCWTLVSGLASEEVVHGFSDT